MNDSPEMETVLPEISNAALLPELRTLIVETRRSAVHNVNSALVQLYWQIGTHVHVDILSQGRAEYGREIVAALRRQFGDGCKEIVDAEHADNSRNREATD